MKKFSFLITFASLSGYASAQSLSPFVIASSGGTFTSANAQLSFTTAEMTMVKTFANGNILTQGFHQPTNFSTAISQKSAILSSSIFPNPAQQFFTIDLASGEPGLACIQLFDNQGKLVYETKPEVAKQELISVNTSAFSEGTYALKITFNRKTNGREQVLLKKIEIIK